MSGRRLVGVFPFSAGVMSGSEGVREQGGGGWTGGHSRSLLEDRQAEMEGGDTGRGPRESVCNARVCVRMCVCARACVCVCTCTGVHACV